MTSSLLDVLILGGGPAGLAVATGLARQMHTAVVLDSGAYRNSRVVHMHNVTGWDHESPESLREKARGDLTGRYKTIKLERGVEIALVARNSNGTFKITDKAGRVWHGRKLVIATGMRDTFSEIDGLEDLWGRGAYPCLFCDGFEFLDAPSAGLLATADWDNIKNAVHYSRMTAQVVKSVNIYTNGNSKLGESLSSVLQEDKRFKIDNRKIVKMTKEGLDTDITIYFSDSAKVTEAFIVSFFQA
jgi:thioredoxin reductase